MKTKILLLSIFLSFSFSAFTSNSFVNAEENPNLLENKLSSPTLGTFNSDLRATDNDPSTFIRMNASRQNVYWELGGSTTVTRVYWDVNSVVSIRFALLDKDFKPIMSILNANRQLVDVYFENVYYVRVETETTSLKDLREVRVYGFNDGNSNPLLEVEGISHKNDYESITVSYQIPENDNFSHLEVFRNGQKILSDYKDTSFKDSGLNPNTRYNYQIVSYGLNGYRTEGVSYSVTTDEAPAIGDVENVEVITTTTDTKILYELPKEKDFSHVVIYRDDVKVADNHTANLYEDTGLKADTEYIYKIVAVRFDGFESKGITIRAKTKPYSKELENIGYERNDNGDYVFKWEEPETGEVIVLIDNIEYRRVAANDKQIIIPEKDLKVDVLGNPKVSLRVVTPEGETGEEYDLETKKIISLTDALGGSMQLFGAISGFVLLWIAIYFQEPLIGLVVSGISKIRRLGG